MKQKKHGRLITLAEKIRGGFVFPGPTYWIQQKQDCRRNASLTKGILAGLVKTISPLAVEPGRTYGRGLKGGKYEQALPAKGILPHLEAVLNPKF